MLYAPTNTTDSLTALEIGLITESYELISVGRRFAQKFYARLFEQAPEMRALFPDELAPQVTKLTDMLAALVGTLDRPVELAKLLHGLGERHVGYGVDAKHFAPVGRALFDTLESEIGPRFDGATRRAWIALYALATSWMRPPEQAHEPLW